MAMQGRNVGRRGQEGMALLIVLWTIGVLTLISAIVTTTTRTEINRARNVLESAKAEGLADAGIYRAIAALTETDQARRPLVDGTIYHWRFDEAEVLIAIQSEAGKIDINSASDQLLKGLFISVGVEPDRANQLVDAIRDFSDRNDLRRALGAEDDDYRKAGMANDAKDGRFENVSELKQVMGMTPELYDSIAAVMTVYSRAKSIDTKIAPRMALLALAGATPARVDEALATRARGSSDGVPWALRPAPESEAPDEEMQTIEPSTSGDEATVTNEPDGSRSGVFTITATAQTPAGGNFERVAVVRLRNDLADPFIFLEWHQGWASSNFKDDRASAGKP